MSEVALSLAVVAVAVSLCCLALVLALARRLRAHGGLGTPVVPGGLSSGPPAHVALPPGSRVPAFSGVDVEGRVVDRSDVSGPAALVAFLSPTCDGCHERLPEFRRTAERLAGPVVAVVVEDGGDGEAVQAAVADVARVVREPWDGPVQRAFAVQGYPAFVVLADGAVSTSGYEVPVATAS